MKQNEKPKLKTAMDMLRQQESVCVLRSVGAGGTTESRCCYLPATDVGMEEHCRERRNGEREVSHTDTQATG